LIRLSPTYQAAIARTFYLKRVTWNHQLVLFAWAVGLILPGTLLGAQGAAAKGACGRVAALPAPQALLTPVAHAEIRDETGRLLAISDATGGFCIPASQADGGSVVAAGYLPASWTPPPSEEF